MKHKWVTQDALFNAELELNIILQLWCLLHMCPFPTLWISDRDLRKSRAIYRSPEQAQVYFRLLWNEIMENIMKIFI